MDRQVTMQCLQVLLCWFNVFSCYNGHGWQKVQAVNEYNLSIARFLCHAKNSYKENAICFLSSHSLEKKVSRSKPRPSSSFKSAWKSRSPQSLVLFFCCFSLFFARFFCMHFHVIDSPLPLLRVSSARPHLSLYSVTYSIQGESSYHLSEIFQTGLSLLICVCGAGTPQYCDLPSLFCLPQSFLGQTFCTLGEIIGSSGSRLERVLS